CRKPSSSSTPFIPPPESTIATSRSLISASSSSHRADTTPIRLTFRGGRTRAKPSVAGRRGGATRGGGALARRGRGRPFRLVLRPDRPVSVPGGRLHV